MKKIIEHIRKWGWLCLLLLAAGCEREEVGMGTEAAEETFSLRCVAEAMGGVRTRVSEPPATIKEYTVMIYKKTGTGTPAENLLVRKEEVAGDGPLTFTAQQDTSEHYMYVLANARGKLSALDPGSKEQLLLETKDVELQPTGVVELTGSPVMCSSKITLRHFDLVTFNQAVPGGIVPLKRNLARLIIRFTVDPAVFTPQEVTYVSMTRTSYLVERKNANEDYLNPVTRTGGTWEEPMYLFEQATVRNQDDGAWKKPGFFLILGGNYKGDTNFYKFGLPAIDGTFADIERNVSYVLNITDIKNSGYTDKNDAMKSTTLFSNVVVMITPNIEGMEDLNEIYTNGYYEMGLNSSEYHFYQATFNDTLTKVVTKALDPSVSSAQLSLAGDPGFYPQTIKGQTFLSFDSRQAGSPDADGFYSTTLVYGTLRKTVKVKMGIPIPWTDNKVLKFHASNGEVDVPPNGPASWTWSSDDWCGLGPNSTFNSTDYFGEIKNSLNENIFVHIRKVDTPPQNDAVRRAILVAPGHVIEVIIQRQ